jgi:hypothetical protein
VLAYLVLFLVLAVCGGSLLVALREKGRNLRDVSELVAGVELHTRESQEPASQREEEISEDMNELLIDIVGAEKHAVAVLAVNELTGRASLARARSQSLARGLSRICLLSGGAGAFAIAALGAFERGALILAMGAFGLGLISAFMTHGLSTGARRHAKKFADLTDLLARQVEERVRDEK